MQTELIRIETPTHPLDGAFYTPDGPSKGTAMYCHGNQMTFTSVPRASWRRISQP